MRGYYEDKDAVLARLRRVEGQVRGLQRMVEADEYCIDILTQITAASNALKKVAVGLLDDHLRPLGYLYSPSAEVGRLRLGARIAQREGSSASERAVAVLKSDAVDRCHVFSM